MKKCILFIFLISFQITLSGQLKQIWEEKYGGRRSDYIYSIIENYDGDYVFVGQSGIKGLRNNNPKIEKMAGGDEDIFFTIVTKNKAVKKIKAIGRKGKESGFDIVQTFDGGYAIVGYTDSKGKGAKGKRDQWLIKLDENGELLWEHRAGSPKQDELRAVAQLTDGSLVVTGTLGDKLYVARLSDRGKLLWKKETTASSPKALGEALVVDSKDDITIIGTAKTGAETNVLLWKLDKDGRALAKPIRQGKKFDEGASLGLGVDESVKFLGTKFTAKGQNFDPWVGDLTPDLYVKDDFIYKKRADESPHAIIQSKLDKHWYVTGGSFSHGKSGGSRKQFFIVKIDSKGKAVWNDWMFEGGGFTDEAFDIMETSDGDIVVGGSTFSDSNFGKQSDGWVIKYKGSGFPTTDGAPTIKVENIAFIDEDEDGELLPGERSYIGFDLVNTGNIDAFQIEGKVSTDGNGKFWFPKNLKLGHLPANTRKRYSLPIVSETDGKPSVTDFNIAFSERNKANISPINQTITTKLFPKTVLAIVDSDWDFTGSEVKAEQPVTLNVRVKNTGDLKATGLIGTFSYERNIVEISDKKVTHGELLPNEEADFKFQFKINKVFKGDTAKITFKFKANEGVYRFGEKANFPLAFNPEILFPVLEVSELTASPQKDIYEPEETVTLNLAIKNTGNLDLTNFKGKFASNIPVEFIGNTSTELATFPIGASKKIAVKVKPSAGFNGTEIGLRFSYTANESPYNKPKNKDISLRYEKPTASVEIAKFELAENSRILLRNKAMEVGLYLRNNGKATAQKVTFGLKPQTGIRLISKPKAISDIPPGETVLKTFKFLIGDDFQGDIVQMLGYFKYEDQNDENLLKFSVEGKAPLLAVSNFKVLSPTPLPIGKELKVQFVVKNSGGQEAEGIEWSITPSSNIQIKNLTGKINTLKPGGSQTIEVGFRLSDDNSKDVAGLKLDLKHLSKRFPQTLKESLSVNVKKQPGKLEFLSHAISDGQTKITRGTPFEIKLKVQNSGASNLSASNLEIVSTEGIKILSGATIAIPPLQANTTKEVVAKIVAPENFEAENFQVTISGLDGLKRTIDFNLGPIPKVAQPAVELIAFEQKQIFKDESASLKITISNKGTGAAKNLKIQLDFNESPEKVSNTNLSIASVLPGKTITKKVSLTPGEAYKSDELKVNIIVTGSDFANPQKRSLTLPLKSRPGALAIGDFKIVNSISGDQISDKSPMQRGEVLALYLHLENTGGSPINNLKIDVEPSAGIISIAGLKKVIPPVIDAKSNFLLNEFFSVPKDFRGTKVDFTINVKGDKINETKKYSIPLKALPPELIVEAFTPDEIQKREAEVTLRATISNKGGSTLNSTKVTWSPTTKGLKELTDLNQNIGDLKPNSSKDIILTVKVPEDFIGTKVYYELLVTGTHSNSSINEKTILDFTVEEKPKEEPIYVRFDWEYPNLSYVDKLRKNTTVKLTVSSNKEIDDKKLLLYNNDKPIERKGKSGEAPLVRPKGEQNNYGQKGIFVYDFEQDILLEDNKNKLELVYQVNDTQQEKSEAIEFSFFEKKIKVFLIAIGINEYGEYTNFRNLHFAEKDAAKFTEAFTNRIGPVYKNVIPFVRNKGKTSRTNIIAELKKLEKAFNDNRIGEDDIIVFYYSGHGKNINEKLYLVPSDYEAYAPFGNNEYHVRENTLVSFEEEVLGRLNVMTGRNVFIFLDACHSGASVDKSEIDNYQASSKSGVDDLAPLIQNYLNRNKRGVVMMNSCRADERSFEMKSEESNGIFTRAILDAFENNPVNVVSKTGKVTADSSSDNILTFKEFREFIKIRVPYLAKSIGEKQTPLFPEKIEFLDDFPFINVIEKK